MALDTHRAVKDLEEAGFEEPAAEAMVSLVSTALTENVATKTDISDMATKADIANLATKSDISDMATKADIADMATKADIADTATKADIVNMATKQDIAELRSELREEIRDLDGRMTVRFIWVSLGIVIITTSLTSGIIGFLNQLQG